MQEKTQSDRCFRVVVHLEVVKIRRDVTAKEHAFFSAINGETLAKNKIDKVQED